MAGCLNIDPKTHPTVTIDAPKDKVIRFVSLKMLGKERIKGLQFSDQQGQVIMIEDWGRQNQKKKYTGTWTTPIEIPEG